MHTIQLTLDIPAALDHAAGPKGLGRGLRADLGLVIKTALTEGFAGPIVRPWRLQATHGRTAHVIAYADENADALRHRLTMALPGVQTIFGQIHSAPTPMPEQAVLYGFDLRAAPVVSVNVDSGIVRRDAFLQAKDRARACGRDLPARDQAYADWLVQRLPGFALEACALRAFRLVPQARHGGSRGWLVKSAPEADFSGLVRVVDSAMAAITVRTGIGRAKAFGEGMLWLTPASAARRAA